MKIKLGCSYYVTFYSRVKQGRIWFYAELPNELLTLFMTKVVWKKDIWDLSTYTQEENGQERVGLAHN